MELSLPKFCAECEWIVSDMSNKWVSQKTICESLLTGKRESYEREWYEMYV